MKRLKKLEIFQRRLKIFMIKKSKKEKEKENVVLSSFSEVISTSVLCVLVWGRTCEVRKLL